MVSTLNEDNPTICVVGLGYVGLPLLEEFSHHFSVIGFDVNQKKVDALCQQYQNLTITTDPTSINQADIVIIAVPTPVEQSKQPDVSYVKGAATIVGQQLKDGVIVVLESTVYPGVTEDVMIPILEEESKKTCGTDFFVGYSPERVNPGDEEHTINKITKIVSGMDAKTTERLEHIYEKITKVYIANDIKTAEAAKVIENVQRDLNIALTNELAMIFHKLGLNTQEVLDAAATKWNFNRFSPGLVGGHCIPVDPYYLVYKAKEIGYHPQVILAGRSVNDSMAAYVAGMLIKALNQAGKVIKNAKVLIMGLTYKENVADTRESPIKNMVQELKQFNIDVYGFDPLLSTEEIEAFDVKAVEHFDGRYEGIVLAVHHDEFKKYHLEDLQHIMNDQPVLIDVKATFSANDAEKSGFIYKTL